MYTYTCAQKHTHIRKITSNLQYKPVKTKLVIIEIKLLGDY